MTDDLCDTPHDKSTKTQSSTVFDDTVKKTTVSPIIVSNDTKLDNSVSASQSQWQKIRRRYLDLLHHYQQQPAIISSKDIALLSGVAVALLLLAVVCYLLGGYQAGFFAINHIAPYIPDFILQNLTVFGDGALLLPLVLLFLPRHIPFHWAIFLVAILCGVLSNTLKDYFGIARPAAVLTPDLLHVVGPAYKSGSFPSGHTLTAFALASVIFCHFKSPLIKYGVLLMAILVGLSRVLNGVHWVIDVLVGGGLGVLIGLAAVMIAAKWRAGLNSYVHPFILLIMLLSCLIVFIDGNDYPLALPLMYLVSATALLQTVRVYVWVER